MSVKVIEGHYYKDGFGDVIGPMELRPDLPHERYSAFVEKDTGRLYKECGSHTFEPYEERDLVEDLGTEWPLPTLGKDGGWGEFIVMFAPPVKEGWETQSVRLPDGKFYVRVRVK